MKKIICLLMLMLSFMFTQTMNAQDNQSGVLQSLPSVGTKIERNLVWIDIEGTYYNNAHLLLQSYYDYRYRKFVVRVNVTQNHKRIYSKRFNDSYMYLFSNGTIQVGRPNFYQLVVIHDKLGYCGKIRQFEGVHSSESNI